MSSSDSEVSFAFWLDPASALTVSYSLPVFHEIDFQVNEGYRRIPHGGVEVGGLLYGKLSGDSLSILAFRPIDCEHASGPSFHLSERDLATLSESIQAVPKDEDLQGMIPLGWFIAHTRSALRMTERELELFDRFFPQPKRIAILIKPERFKPTRFAFLLRDASGTVNPDGEQQAVILPLPGRPGRAGAAPSPAIPAPKPIEIRQPIESVSPALPVASVPEALDGLPETSTPYVSARPAPATDAAPSPPHAIEGIPIMDAATGPEPHSAIFPEPVEQNARALRQPPQQSRASRLLLVLGLAALLGCAGGYWAYLQLPPSIISLRVQKQSNDLFVLWDPAQTQSSRYAVIRVNDSPPVLLTDEQKAAGIAEVRLAGSSIKVEIIAEHWVRESRGIIRFLPAHPGTIPQKSTSPE